MSKITNDGLTRSGRHRMLYSCSHVSTVGVNGITRAARLIGEVFNVSWSVTRWSSASRLYTSVSLSLDWGHWMKASVADSDSRLHRITYCRRSAMDDRMMRHGTVSSRQSVSTCEWQRAWFFHERPLVYHDVAQTKCNRHASYVCMFHCFSAPPYIRNP